jgi:hypothetical protein
MDELGIQQIKVYEEGEYGCGYISVGDTFIYANRRGMYYLDPRTGYGHIAQPVRMTLVGIINFELGVFRLEGKDSCVTLLFEDVEKEAKNV